MLERMFQPHPESVLNKIHMLGGARRGMRWYPLLMLVWTFWIFATPFFYRALGWRVMPQTIACAAIFLVLYYAAYFGDRRYVNACAAGMAVLAFVLTPLNPGAHGFLIYACAFFCVVNPVTVALRLSVLALAAYAVECLLIDDGNWIYPSMTAMFAFAIGFMNINYRRTLEINAELRLSHDEVRRLAATAERERIGRDLHDLLGHTLSLIALKSELANRLWERDPISARQEVREVERVARDALAQVRRAVSGIRAAGFAAESAAAKLLLDSAGVAFDYGLDPVALPPALETSLALALREAMTNIQRHARAHRASVKLEALPGVVRVEVSDDGCGGDIVPGNGLAGMRERLAAVGASLSIDSACGRGTRLVIVAPLLPDAVPAIAPDASATHVL